MFHQQTQLMAMRIKQKNVSPRLRIWPKNHTRTYDTNYPTIVLFYQVGQMVFTVIQTTARKTVHTRWNNIKKTKQNLNGKYKCPFCIQIRHVYSVMWRCVQEFRVSLVGLSYVRMLLPSCGRVLLEFFHLRAHFGRFSCSLCIPWHRTLL